MTTLNPAQAQPATPAGGPLATRTATRVLDARLWIAVTVVLIAAVAGRFAIIGGDSRWLAALGQIVVHRGSITTGVPFAAASTSHWPNTLVLAELIFYVLEHTMGDTGLLVAQTIAVAAAA